MQAERQYSLIPKVWADGATISIVSKVTATFFNLEYSLGELYPYNTIPDMNYQITNIHKIEK